MTVSSKNHSHRKVNIPDQFAVPITETSALIYTTSFWVALINGTTRKTMSCEQKTLNSETKKAICVNSLNGFSAENPKLFW